MDPDATLREMRAIADRVRQEDVGDAEYDSVINRLVELFDALDGWMCKGGALPVQWKAYR